MAMKIAKRIFLLCCLSFSVVFVSKAITSKVYADTLVATENSEDNLIQSAITVFNAVNAQRVAMGIEAVEWDAELYSAACLRAQEASVLWSHTRPDGTMFDSAIISPWIWRGENLAWQKNGLDADIVQWWIESPSHYEVMMYAGFTKGAVGVYHCDGKTYYSLLLVGNN